MTIKHATTLIDKPDYSQPVPFGKFRTDHMLEIDYDSVNGWGNPYISGFHDLSIDPRNSTLHYAIELFEGMKAFYGTDGRIRLFRPDINMTRMNRSAARVGLPQFGGEELIRCIIKLIELDQSFVPRDKGFSLYIRPTFISMTNILGVAAPAKSKIFVILSPVGPYFSGGKKSISIKCSPEMYSRSWRGGFGNYKIGANYGPTFGILY